MNVAELIGRIRQGDVRALARAVSLVEDDAPPAREILSGCFPYSGSAVRIGITGPPGAGKSTLVDGLARRYRAQPSTVGVIAVDPTSPYTGGAILGDRIRMRDHDGDPGFYMRSMAPRGSLGGLARASADVAVVIEASGKQRLLLETVGVGQDEIDIVRLADVTIVVLVPGMGDDVQSLKAGVMEIADIFVVNKSDREGADRVEQEIRGLQSLAPAQKPAFPSGHNPKQGDDPGFVSGHDFSRADMASKREGALAPESAWTPPVIRTTATTGEGIDALAAAINEMEQWLRHEKR